jgi:hypothetical protein
MRVYEVVALLAGVVLGLAVHRRTRRLVWLWGAAWTVIVGAGLAALSGELAESWAFALFDIAQVAVAAACTAYLAIAWRRRRSTT